MPFNPNIFEVDWRRFARMFTPVELRRSKLMAMLYAALSPIAVLHATFISFRSNVQYRLGINYQVCYLEKLLNDTYDVVDRRIYIDNQPQAFLPKVLYTKAEGRPVKLFLKSEAIPVKLYRKAETPAGALNFIIFVHQDILFNNDEMSGLVRQYCLQTKNFLIQLYA
jgi:hypothetical protein